jgi:conjugative relaxase-like TrwC/TraI family protein
MLNVTAQRSPEAAKSYFAKSDYYSEGQELIGEWGGKGAVLAGLFGQVEKPAFDSLCDNVNPVTHEPLTPITRGNRRTGYDFTWSAPKSVSLVHAMTGDERIVKAFRESINDTMSEMEADMQTRVRKGRVELDRTTGNMLWAEFIHLTSRPVNGIPCPQLHAHCFAFNASYDSVEGQWKAGQFGKIKGDGYYWQAVQQARFANRLQTLGYSIAKTKDAFEIAGVSLATIQKFSLRTSLIERVAAKLGITDPKAKAKLAATTREAKLNAIPYSQLVRGWDQQLTPAERDSIAATRGQPQKVAAEDKAHAGYAADHLFERSSVIDERRLLTLALRHGIGEVSPEGVRAQANRLGLLKREETGKMWVTTPQVLAEENAMLRFAVNGKGSCLPLTAGQDNWHQGLSASGLSGQQQAAVAHLLTSPDRVMILRGAAGSGKTTLTTEAVRQIESAGKPVVMLAPSAQASRGVLRDEGFKDADTLSRFLIDNEMQATAMNGVIWLDEAGLVGSRTMASLFKVADHLNARIILAGDKRQMASVERGVALRTLEDVAGLKIAEVTDIRRQSGEYKEAVKLLSTGRTTEGLAKLDAMGWVKLMSESDPYAPIARDYVDKLRMSHDRERSALIVSPTHAEGARITAEVRRELKDQGMIGKDDRQFTRLVPLQWTEAERGDERQYAGDEVLQFHRNSGYYKAGERIEAGAIFSSARPTNPAHFATYARSTIDLTSGDLIRITANGKTAEGNHKLNNGAVYTIAGFTSGGDIALSNGWIVGKDFGQISHAYVSTAHASQGRTVDHVLIAQSAMSYPASSREGFYVSVSRGRRSATIYTDDKQELRDAVNRSNPRLAATELLKKPKPQLWRRVRDAMARVQLAALVAAKTRLHELNAAKEKELTYAR